MKRAFAIIGTVLLLVVCGFGQADVIIKKRAQEIRDQNNVRQGVTPPAQSAQPAAAPVTRASPTPVQQSVAKLQTDLKAVKGPAKVTADQRQRITNDLIALAHGAKKPSQSTAANLTDGLLAAFAEKPLIDKDLNRFLSDLAAVFNPTGIQSAQMQAIYGDIQAIFQANGTARKDAVKLVDLVKAAGAETT
jgi:hypothetical protein